ncbi:hypothetical protein [Bacillus sp. T33-2]|uniref:hypothetical protein n=1 Tax=Bacillus sp. T33-2 TaxID=2054168 RepID=UPI000C778F7A|nr:hypothetical protein [Bacillus sp. T33-2]PLR97252.1 hypothetical protein CVD19_07105 [Bacillus sp. T33-2]
MSLKSIEMQVALPRTHEAGKIQEQIQQRGQHIQEHAAQSVQKEDDQKRNTVYKHEQKKEAGLNQDQSPGHHHGSNQERKQKEPARSRQEPHPYKGKIIDYSG